MKSEHKLRIHTLTQKYTHILLREYINYSKKDSMFASSAIQLTVFNNIELKLKILSLLRSVDNMEPSNA